ncbi:MAG: helix-turn-helix domain-containing protein [Candidatus Thorarchaeota archaeon]
MKIVRLQIPGNFLEQIGFKDLFDKVEFVEILNAFQYDQTHFFALQKIRFKRNINIDIKEFIMDYFKPESLQVLNQSGDEIICIMDQSRTSGFFPIIDSGPWAFLFPIQVSSELVLLSIISHKDYLENLFDILSSYTNDFKIIGMFDLNKTNEFDEAIWRTFIPLPHFTKRQREIASYAAKKGYFKTPKEISGKEIATHFKINEATVNKHLKNTRNLAMEYFFGKYI